MKLSLALCVAFSIVALPAIGQPIPSPKGFVMMTFVQTRPDQVGDHYSYLADIHSRTVRSGAVKEVEEYEWFDVEIIGVAPKSLTVRFTQTRFDETPAAPDEPSQMLAAAWNGVPIEFETDRSGLPSRILNEDQAKSKVVANFTAQSPKAQSIAPSLKQWLDHLPESEFSEMVGGKLTMLGAMQLRGALPMGHQDLIGESHKDADGTDVQVKKTADISLAQGAPCRVWVQRTTWTERPGGVTVPSSNLKTEATLSEEDGWVIDLTEVAKTTLPVAEQVLSTKISRQAGQACGRAK